MVLRRFRFLPLLLLLTLALPARGQLLSEDARVSLVTVLPGDAVYSMFGHSALRVVDPAQGLDESFNYGTFEFDAWFVPTFLYGRLDYFLSAYPFPRAATFYETVERRPIIEQQLDLTHEERVALYRFLLVNSLPENRSYRYDFLYDNCSTRIRDVLVEILGDSLRILEAGPSASFRQLLQPYLEGRPFVDAGIDLALGMPVDRRATTWETMFLPDHLMDVLGAAVVVRGGETRPLVARTDTLVWFDGYDRSPGTFPWASLLAWVLLAGGAAATWREHRRHPEGRRWLDPVLFGVVGLVGLLVAFLWFVSLHDVTAKNWNLLWAWPTHAVAAVLLARRGASGRALRLYLAAAAAAAALFLAGWAFWPQALHPVAIPLALLVALRAAARALGARSRVPAERAETAA